MKTTDSDADNASDLGKNQLGKQRLADRQRGNSVLVEEEEKRDDLGFGTQINDASSRLLNKDGSFNVVRAHQGFWNRINLYHTLITMPWPKFLSLVLVFYLVTNTLFAALYALLGYENLTGLGNVTPHTAFGRFMGAFFFSSQTLTTVGYGHISPMGYWTSALAAIESMFGLLLFAMATGVMYGRFSRPVASIRYSQTSIFAPYLDINAWMFRVINQRTNQLIDVQVEVTLSRLDKKPDGSLYRRYYPLKLERNKVNFFPANWTVVHPITDDSPLYGFTAGQLAESDSEILILLRGIEDTFNQPVHSRFSYRFNEIRWGQKFIPMFNGTQYDSRATLVDLDQLDQTTPAELN